MFRHDEVCSGRYMEANTTDNKSIKTLKRLRFNNAYP